MYMNFVILTIISLLALTCENTPEAAQNKASASEEKTERTETVSSDIVLSNESEKVIVSKDVKQDAERTFESKETINEVKEPSKPIELVQEKANREEKAVTLPNHSQWNSLLAKYVDDNGNVTYKAFQNDAVALDEYLNHLAENSPKKEWAKNEKLAYYINLYNAATVKLILDNYPTKSIKDIKNPWGKDWVKTGDGVLSLGDIEHKILRKMNEPRIHFAINCASFSCPKLLNKAFTPAQMEAQLQEVTFDFINDETRNNISKEEMQLSNIFRWYKKDFTENSSLADYIKPYTEVEINSDTDIGYLEYNWNLNEIK